MKKLVLIAGIFLCAFGAKAQNQGDISLDLYGGYTFQDKIYADAAYVAVKDGFQYGAGIEFYARSTKSIELKYLRMDTKTPIYRFNGVQLNSGDDSSAINYVLIAGNNYFPTGNPKVLPFAGLGLGVGWASGDQSTSARFAWDLKAGVKIKTSDSVSLKLQAYFQTIWASYGSDAVFYPGYGTVYYPSDASLYQFGLGAAISFDFKH
ncbi:outer membrane beta-barrel protein [Flavobacterium alvei]|uniref:outer membrane beta-barrel protein n=1 Tax=Flavobacterium alvei TaxID=2080416 RepID=UPI0026F2F039|nr:outer membrane beta-barrel protein [Flavobacterium alvei]